MKIIFVNRFFYPDVSATSQMLSDQVFALAEQGREVVVITSQHGYSDASECYAPQEMIGSVKVYRVWTSNFGRLKLFGRGLDYASFLFSSSWCLFSLVRRGDIVVAKTDPPMLSVLAYPVCALRGAKLVNWLQDFFPEAAVALKVGRSRAFKWVLSALKHLRNRSLRRARANVVIGAHMAGYVKKLGVAPERIVTIPNWANRELVYPIPHGANALRRQWGLQGSFVVVYSGNLGRVHDYLTFLEAIARLECLEAGIVEDDGRLHPVPWSRDMTLLAASLEQKVQLKSIRWLFIGGGANYEKLQKEVVMRGLKSVLFQDYQARDCLAESLSCADVHLVSLRPEMEGLSVPSKVYGSLASGRPIVFVGDSNGEIATMIAKYNCGVAVEPGDGAALACVIFDLATDNVRTREMGERSRRVLDAHFDLRHAIKRWQGVLDRVMAER